ncbi:class I SAM-dependent methyltransferase [Hoeflea sp. TYP-13]|uniref:class I SAM-dependent methyltransferase n=1 Tax=Hoeflea sp. TYP-13 TaxID=3230023 RepID=UPI0034C5CA27
MPHDIPSAIDLRLMEDASKWASNAEQRPGRNAILDRLVEEAGRRAGPDPLILELGSGPGFLAHRMLKEIPQARYTALDFSPAMHALARARVKPFIDRITFLERSFKSDSWAEDLQPFDIVVTNQAVHELRHKRHAKALHQQVHGLLTQEGSYLVSDHFSGDGGLPDTELFMSADEQSNALSEAGFPSVTRIAAEGSLVLHLARKI